MNEKYYCGVDIGAQTIKAGILKIREAADMELIGAYDHKTYGFKDNAVSDLGEFSECVHRTVGELAKRTGVKLKDVQLGVGGAMVETRSTSTVIPLTDRGNKVITPRDVKKVNDNARLLGIKMEEEVLHDLPQYYKIDDVNAALNPLGLYGRKLGVCSLMVLINDNRVRNITKAVHQAGYDVANVFFSTYAASDVVLTEAEKMEGCVLIDIGSKFTSLLIFRDGVPQSLERVDIGGDNFTRGIADDIHLSFDLAEEIKKSYALASGTDEHGDEEILVKREDAYIPVKRGLIYQAVNREAQDLVERIGTAIAGSGLREKMDKGITMVGGGALLPGLIERISESTQLPARLGQMNLPLRKNLSHTATYSSVVGLARAGYKKSFRYAMSPKEDARWAKHFVNRVKDLYQEYF
jgi:cell division protein FtsA